MLTRMQSQAGVQIEVIPMLTGDDDTGNAILAELLETDRERCLETNDLEVLHNHVEENGVSGVVPWRCGGVG